MGFCMAGIKTKKTEESVDAFLSGIADEQRRKDSVAVLALMKAATKAEAKMWGSAIVGLGQRTIRYPNGRELDWFSIGFSPRKDALALYLAGGVETHAELVEKLGKYKTGKGCLYIKRLDDVNLPALKALLKAAVAAAKSS